MTVVFPVPKNVAPLISNKAETAATKTVRRPGLMVPPWNEKSRGHVWANRPR
jgi:hypothetical protein